MIVCIFVLEKNQYTQVCDWELIIIFLEKKKKKRKSRYDNNII